MTYQKSLLAVTSLGVLLLITLWFTRADTTPSPLMNEPKVQEIQQHYQADLYLPTDLLGRPYLRDIKTISTSPDSFGLEMEMDLLVEKSTLMGQFSITSAKTKEKEITYIIGEPIDEILKNQNPKNPTPYADNQIQRLEPVQLRDGTGYWYELHMGPHRMLSAQRIEFIQDGYAVMLSTTMLPKDFTKEQMIAIANSFHEFEF